MLKLDLSLSKIIIINKIISGVVRWVDINHLHLPEICFPQDLQHLEIIPFNVKILSIIEIHTLHPARPQSRRSPDIRLPDGLPLVRPGELIPLFTLSNYIIGEFLLEFLKINRQFRIPICILPLSYAIREQCPDFLDIGAGYIHALHFHLFH